jgi:hypothetical protein
MHAVVHVLEMQGRAHEGLAFLAANERAWREGNAYAVHLAWHRALFHLELQDVHAALAVYDAQIAPPHAGGLGALADASALWRLSCATSTWATGGGRPRSAGRANRADLRAFNVLHAMMAFAAENPTGAARLLAALRTQGAPASGDPPADALVRPLCEAFVSFAREDYARCVEWLARVRPAANRCGGSLAQCDLIHLTFTEAALRARRVALAGALVAERTRRKPSSPFNRLLLQRVRMALPAWA